MANHLPFKLTLLNSPIPLGKGGAIREGVKISEGRYVAFIDVDLPVDISFLKSALELVEGHDIVNGSRFKKGSKRTDPYLRLLLSRGYHWFFRLLFHLSFDTQCGFKVCKRNAAEHVFDHVATDGFSFDTEFIIQAKKLGYEIKEIPITWLFDRNTPVKAISLAWRMLWDLITIKLRAMKPMHGDRRDKQQALAFYNKVPGDIRWRAAHTWFLPRRLWYKLKDRRLLKVIKRNPKPCRILDVGCGSGLLLKCLSDDGYTNLNGIDISTPAINFTNQLLGRDVAHWADASNLPFPDEAFDIVVASEVIEHMNDLEGTLSEWKRVLTKDGKLIITTPKAGFNWDLVEAIWMHLRRESLEFNHSPISEMRLKWSLIKKGFKIETFNTFLFGCELFIEAVKNENSNI